MEYKPIVFPGDEFVHTNTTEWWYYSGNLFDVDGNRYAYMDTLFRVRMPKVLSKAFDKLPSNNSYFYHSVITDVKHQKVEKHINHIVLVHEDINGDNFNLRFGPLFKKKRYCLSKKSNDEYHVAGKKVNLDLVAKKQPLLVGETGFVDNVGEETYYYSLPKLKTTGEIIVGGKKIKVSGESWMDHQWGDFSIPRGYWNWFSIQLNNNIQIVCYEDGNDEGIKKLATVSFSNNSQKSFADVDFLPTDRGWKSPQTHKSYHLNWTINIQKINLALNISVPVRKQEVVYRGINYWEGPIDISGKFDGKTVKGLGFMELARFS